MQTGAREWRNYWTLPLAAALGNSASVLHIYSIGPFMASLESEFGWSRAQISVGLTIAGAITAIGGIGTGILLDRFGPRRVGIIGAAALCALYALLGTATGSILNWILLWALIGIAAAGVTPTIWTSAVASRFDASRGLAIALTISGSGIAATIIPVIAAWIIGGYGWRAGFFGLAGIWALALLPMLMLFFYGRQDQRKGPSSSAEVHAGGSLPGLTLREGLRSAAFYKLGVAAMLFSFGVIGLIVHLVPVLQDRGLDRLGAASVAGLVGLSSIAGRLGTGFLLDRFRASRVGMAAFLLPTISTLLLLIGDGTFALAVAALVLGLSLGSELDVVLYFATRYFGLKRFGVLFATMAIGMAIGTSLGPVSAGAVYDVFGSYNNFLLLIFPIVILGSALIATLGPYPDHGEEIEIRAG
ncbi:MFS transporter [Novosphingobium endophyticum]|uniref:MFS transporter n=1 Tax=Novosphingobium endophyticum TaxID=1955250 RepID=A0A916TV16_9SPHN|nr:MFS transporter [Novosphingobium endophyticum]GGC13220.1 MFS transporter [Novosphingobium endophyticum]